MLEQDKAQFADGETELRRRLASKLAARGIPQAEIGQKIEDILRDGLKLRLPVDEILGDT